MFELKVITDFAAAHQLKMGAKKCENLHGHNWKIEVYATGIELGKDGLLIDFKILKDATQKALDELDHKFLNELDAFRSVNPSSENIARHVFKSVSKHLNCQELKVSKVTAWESESACASYMET